MSPPNKAASASSRSSSSASSQVPSLATGQSDDGGEVRVAASMVPSLAAESENADVIIFKKGKML